MKSPGKKPKKDTAIQIKLTTPQKKILQTAAEKMNMPSLSSYVLKAALDDATRVLRDSE